MTTLSTLRRPICRSGQDIARALIVALADHGCQPRQRGEDRWSARCPAHSDRTPSLSIRAAEDRVLIHCFAGCQTTEVMAELGWSMAALFVPSRSTGWRRTRLLAPRVRRVGEPIVPTSVSPIEKPSLRQIVAEATARGEQVLVTDDAARTVAYPGAGDMVTVLVPNRWGDVLDFLDVVLAEADVVVCVGAKPYAGSTARSENQMLARWIWRVAARVEVAGEVAREIGVDNALEVERW